MRAGGRICGFGNCLRWKNEADRLDCLTHTTKDGFDETLVALLIHVFTFNFKVENLKLLSGDYDVTVSSKNLSKFVSHSRPVCYYIAIEPDSSYN